jgi:hypothetical protein
LRSAEYFLCGKERTIEFGGKILLGNNIDSEGEGRGARGEGRGAVILRLIRIQSIAIWILDIGF